jgi:hypothetical protein
VDHVDADDPVSSRDRPNWIRRVQAMGARAFVTSVAFTHAATLSRVRFRIGRLENESREMSGEMDDMFA